MLHCYFSFFVFDNIALLRIHMEGAVELELNI